MILGSYVARGGFLITPHATDPLPDGKRAFGIMCTGEGGTIVVTCDDGSELELPIETREILPFIITHVHTDSTATGLIGITAWK